MTFDKFERYELTNVPEGLQISYWQALPSLGIGVVALVLLAACFLTDPYHGHNRIWAGLGVATLAFVAVFGVKVETWIISDRAIRYKNGLWNKEQLWELSSGDRPIAHVEFILGDSEGTTPSFPHVVHLLGPGRTEIGDGFRFRDRSNMLGFVESLQELSVIERTD